MKQNRRTFIKTAALGTAGLALSHTAAGYSRILGANDRINMAFVGVHNRGWALMNESAKVEGIHVAYLCDVHKGVLDKRLGEAKKLLGYAPKVEEDFRKILEDPEVDAVAIATPEHLHAPQAIMALVAGKHVYVEKPCSHNPRENEMIVEAQQKHGKVVQMGNQQRSAPTSMQAVQDIREGLIGDVYYGKAWYANSRGSIGRRMPTTVPDELNWDLWQGPAPRRPYETNIVHYDWHWYYHWGTGEIHNNGTHEIDICRWALGVDYPTQVVSAGGRFHFKDDWEFYDTQDVSYTFEGDKMITWEGRSCNPMRLYDRGRGAALHGTKGTILLDRNAYEVYDMDNKQVKRMTEDEASVTLGTGGGGGLTTKHLANFAATIRESAKQHSPIHDAAKSTLLCHLGNLAQEAGGSLDIDPSSGHPIDNPKAMAMWDRAYEPGWEPKY